MSGDEPRKQHLLSQSLLRAWTVDKMVRAFDKTVGRHRLRSTKAEGFQIDFVKVQAAETELLWKKIEDEIPRIRAGLEESGANVTTAVTKRIADLMALHFARSRLQPANFEQSLESSVRRSSHLTGEDLRSIEEGLNQWLPIYLPPGSSASTNRAKRFMRSALRAGVRPSRAFRDGVIAHLKLAQDEIAKRDVIVLESAPNTEFLIGDTPAVVIDPVERRLGGPLRPRSLLMLPLSPRFAAIAGSEPSIELDTTAVDRLNQAQYRAAATKVYLHPDSSLLATVQTWFQLDRTGDDK